MNRSTSLSTFETKSHQKKKKLNRIEKGKEYLHRMGGIQQNYNSLKIIIHNKTISFTVASIISCPAFCKKCCNLRCMFFYFFSFFFWFWSYNLWFFFRSSNMKERPTFISFLAFFSSNRSRIKKL